MEVKEIRKEKHYDKDTYALVNSSIGTWLELQGLSVGFEGGGGGGGGVQGWQVG